MEKYIKILKERYIDAHCNPDFKGDKMEYIFQPLPEQESKSAEEIFKEFLKTVHSYSHSTSDRENPNYRIDYRDLLRLIKYAQSHQVEMPIRDILLAYVNYTDFDVKDVIDDEWLVDRFLNSIKIK